MKNTSQHMIRVGKSVWLLVNYRAHHSGAMSYLSCVHGLDLSLKAPVTTAADDKFLDIFPN